MRDLVEVVAYNSAWPTLFESEAELIKKALGKNCLAIHHIGSTAVPDLSAKPIIDLLPVVKDILQVDPCNAVMSQLGYEIKGEYGIAFRRFFQKGSERRTHNVHVFEEGNSEIERHLKFRDWMRTHAPDREAYGALKTDLALKYPNDILSYCLGKDAFVAEIDSKTGFHGLRMVQALTDREWQAVRRLRQENFFDRVPIEDPYTWTFKHAQHLHWVLYKDTQTIGYAYLQLWPESRVAMRMLVIDGPYRNQGLGSAFLRLCERWLTQHKMKTLLVQSSPGAYRFYCNNGYVKMPFNDPEGYETDPRDIEVGKDL
jgi:GrpB-like predicted nucleotidyltransferase (UPF0157 family)/GNAT superfamily N-acetyltransferase